MKGEKMEKEEILKLVEFCVLMQNGKGIMGKAPSYIEEKFETCHGDGTLLDFPNGAVFEGWKRLWLTGK